MSNLDDQIKKDIKKHTEQDLSQLQDEIWGNLENELFSEKPTRMEDVKKMKMKMKKKKRNRNRNRMIPLIVTVAAALAIMFTLQTNPGMAFVKSIKDLFVQEKEIIQNIEGQDEPTDVSLNEGKDSEYVIYIDEERYKMIPGEDADTITTVEALPEKFPAVTMEIKQVADEKPEELVKKIEAELKVDFPELHEIETVTEPVEGFLLHGLHGQNWDSKVVHLYVISNGKEGSYIIRENYFLEAAEGHGSRFHHMLESFEIVE